MSDSEIRQEQQTFFRTAEGRRGTARKSAKPAKAGQPKGHESFLKALEISGATVVFIIASSGERVEGKIKTSDKYTVSVIQPLNGDRYLTRVLFKHDISEFRPLVPAPTTGE